MEGGQQHSFSKAEAGARIEKLTAYWTREHGVSVSRSGNKAIVSGKILGCKFDANLVVTDADVTATGTDQASFCEAR